MNIELGDPLTLPHPQLGAAGGTRPKNSRRVSTLASRHKDGKDVPYPSWEELRAEDRETKPGIV